MFQASDTQGRLFGGYTRLAEWVGEDTFYAFLGREGRRIFDDELFREWYCEDNGRPCVPPSSLAIATVLQMYERCSDEEAIERCMFDERWKVALDLEDKEKPFAKSTFQQFRAKLLLHEGFETLFLRLSLGEAVRHGLLKKGSTIKSVLDTTPVLGRGAVKDTYNLVADGIRILCRALSQASGEKLDALVSRLDLTRYFDEKVSLKGSAQIDWSNDAERRVFLNSLVADAQRALLEAKRIKKAVSDKQKSAITSAEELLSQLVTQDVEPDPATPGKVRIREGTAKDRIPSAHDPQMRHGRKSASKRFDGHKLAVVAEPESGLVTALEVLAGNASDSHYALELVKEVEHNTGAQVEKSIGDCAYGDGASRQRFADAERELVAKVPAPPSNEPFHKAHFHIDLQNQMVTCPAGQTTTDWRLVSHNGEKVPRFFFPVEVCQACPFKEQCYESKDGRYGRRITLHPQEAILQEAREYQKQPEFRQDMKDRQQAEHVLARLVQLGARQARYFGRAKTKIQLIIIAAVLNLLIVSSALRQEKPPVSVDGSQPLPAQPHWPPRDSQVAVVGNTTTNGRLLEHETDTLRNGIRGAPGSAAYSARGDP